MLLVVHPNPISVLTNVHSVPEHDTLRPPPSQSILMNFANTPVGRIIASNTTKIIAGNIAGLGFVLCSTGVGAAAGVPLIVAGAVLWLLSTVLSTAKLENKSPRVVFWHLLRASLFGVVGGVMGAVSTSLIAGMAIFNNVQILLGLIGGGIGVLIGLWADIEQYFQNTLAPHVTALHESLLREDHAQGALAQTVRQRMARAGPRDQQDT